MPLMYYLAHQDVQEIGTQVFGEDIKELGLLYYKKNRIWYRILQGGIIQFIGIKQYSQGFYDINIAAQPLYVPMYDLSEKWLKKGEVPCYHCYGDVSSIYGRMERLNLVSPTNSPKLTGLKTDPLDVIIGHMKVTYKTIARPVLYEAVSDESCYEYFQKAKNILIKMARDFIGEERAEMTTKQYNLFEIITLGGMGKFQEARQALEMDKVFHPLYAKNLLSCGFLNEVENNDWEGFRRTIAEIRVKNLGMLKKNGLIKSNEMI